MANKQMRLNETEQEIIKMARKYEEIQAVVSVLSSGIIKTQQMVELFSDEPESYMYDKYKRQYEVGSKFYKLMSDIKYYYSK